jgi:hypothetical protein
MTTKFEELCNEDKILVFFKKLLNEWNQELDEMTELEKQTAKEKSMVATFKQCARYLSRLFEFCRKKVLILMQFSSVGCLNCAINMCYFHQHLMTFCWFGVYVYRLFKQNLQSENLRIQTPRL